MKTAIITGAYGAIGSEIAKGLAHADHNIILLGRNRSRLLALAQEIKEIKPGIKCAFYEIDVSDKDAVFKLASGIDQSIDILINNAAIAPVKRSTNTLGIEMQWATNVLGYYWMIKAFQDRLAESPSGRIVNVASYWAGGLDLDDPEFKRRPYNNDTAYRQSKQANRMLTYGFSNLFEGKLTVNACHPGDANSKLSNDLGFGGSESARQAAQTPIYLATSENVEGTTGGYFVSSRKASCQFKGDKVAINRLMELCESY